MCDPCRARDELWPRISIISLLMTCWRLNWFLGCSVLVSVCCGGRPPCMRARWSLSELCLEDTPRGEGPVLLFLFHSIPLQYFKL